VVLRGGDLPQAEKPMALITAGKNTRRRSVLTGGVVVEGLRKQFGGVIALDGIDLAVPEGSVGAVLGQNGAGKTTAIRVLSTLLSADGGRATVAGFDVFSEPHYVRSVISLTGQYAAVDDDLTGSENLTMIGRLGRLSRQQARVRADELLERFALSFASSRLVRAYSGGMRRRLDLAASLVVPPRVLFLDEPTTGLDPPSRLQLWEVVRGLRDDGTTILLTTQYLEEADRLADMISVVDHGRIIAAGTAAQLKARSGGEVLELTARDRIAAHAAAFLIASKLGVRADGIAFRPDGRQTHLRIPTGSLSVLEAVRVLDSEGIALEDISLRRSSLDDVFLALTGHTTEGVTSSGPDSNGRHGAGSASGT
jgi:ABC-2 type transport system ATP-binding protein